jgi:hypothetical protein
VGLSSAKDDLSGFNRRSLYWGEKFLGDFNAHEGWELVRELRIRSAVGKEQLLTELYDELHPPGDGYPTEAA